MSNSTSEEPPSEGSPTEAPSSDDTPSKAPSSEASPPATSSVSPSTSDDPSSSTTTTTTETSTLTNSTEKTENSTASDSTHVPNGRRFDGWSFFGGILLTVGFLTVGFVVMKYYKVRQGGNAFYNRFWYVLPQVLCKTLYDLIRCYVLSKIIQRFGFVNNASECCRECCAN